LTESEEAALVRRCQERDKDAFRMLVEKYKKVVFGTAYFMTRDRVLAEDAMQEALIQIWKYLPSLRQDISLKSWILRIVVNEVNQQRTKQFLSINLNSPCQNIIDSVFNWITIPSP
jgi:RNA polymerase sigma-70 factor (ECF subfamily)